MPTLQKLDFKREYAELYRAGSEPTLVEVPMFTYLMIDGHGAPGRSEEFAHSVEALYSASYALKAMIHEREEFDYVVMPLEGLWFDPGDQISVSDWTLMILQPHHVKPAMLNEAVDAVVAKKDLRELRRLRLEDFHEGHAAQVLHVGSYEMETPTIERLRRFIEEQGMHRVGRHHEIYLSDPGRTPSEKLRTILRQPARSYT